MNISLSSIVSGFLVFAGCELYELGNAFAGSIGVLLGAYGFWDSMMYDNDDDDDDETPFYR